MPTYAYACKDCGHAFDIFQSFSDDALTECPQCSGRLRKKFGNVGVTFKGSGFYRTDSRASSSSAETAGSNSSAESKTSAAASSSANSNGTSAANGSKSPSSKSSGSSKASAAAGSTSSS